MRKDLALISVVLAVLMLTVGCKNKPPNIPARPVGPDSILQDTLATYSSVTTDPNRDQVLYVFDWDDSQNDTTNFNASGDTVSVSHAWTDTGSYAIRVKAKDEKGLFSADWSDTHMVYVIISGSPVNHRPNPPDAPTGPDTGWVDSVQVFSASATDPDGDSVRLRFIWGEDNRVSYWSPLVPSGATVTDSVTYFNYGVKNIRAVAMDKDSALSDTSSPKVFFANQSNTKPGKPTITGPGRGIKNGPEYRFYARSRDPEGDSVQYKFFWGDGDSSAWTQFYQHDIPVMDSWSYSAEGTYNLRAIARDQGGLVSDTSDSFTFVVVGEGTVIWGYLFGEEIISSPALTSVANTQGESRPAVVIGITNGLLVAMDAYLGEILHTVYEPTFEAFHSSPAIGEDGTVYIGNENGNVYALDMVSDTFSWCYPDSLTGDDMGATPVVDGNNIYVGGENGCIQQLRDDGTSVTELWNYHLKEELNASPVLDPNGNLIVGDDSGYVYSFAPDHSLNWTFNVQGNITSSPAIGSDGTVYVGTEQSKLFAISSSGSQLWCYEITPSTFIYSSPVIGLDGSIYFGANDGYLYRLDKTTGQPMQNWPVLLSQSEVSSTPAVSADGIIYVTSDDDVLHAVREDGTVAWNVELKQPESHQSKQRRFGAEDLLPSPVIDQYGIIYVASGFDGVFAIAGRSTGTLAQTPWPMFHHDIRHTGKFNTW